MSRSLNLVIIIAVIAVAASAVNYYINFLPDQKIKQEETRLRMEENAAQEKVEQKARIEDRYHKCMQDAVHAEIDKEVYCKEYCKSRGGDDKSCLFYSNCPPLTPEEDRTVELDLKQDKEVQDSCLNEMRVGMENLH